MKGENNNAKVIECVNPRCASSESTWFIQAEQITSISGMLFAAAPHNIACFPSFFPAKASPAQAPRTICVTESKVEINFNVCEYLN